MLERKTYTIGTEGVEMSTHSGQAENLTRTLCSLVCQVELVQHDTVRDVVNRGLHERDLGLKLSMKEWSA